MKRFKREYQVKASRWWVMALTDGRRWIVVSHGPIVNIFKATFLNHRKALITTAAIAVKYNSTFGS